MSCPHVFHSHRAQSQGHWGPEHYARSPVPTFLCGQHPLDTLASPGSGGHDPGFPDLSPRAASKGLTRGFDVLWRRARPGYHPKKGSGWTPIPG